MYEVKIRDVVFCFATRSSQILNNLKEINIFKNTKLKFAKEIEKITSFVNVKVKIYYDVRHKSFLLKSENEAYIYLHHGYKLFDQINKKLKNQRCNLFKIIKRMKRLVYELKLSTRWKIHSVIFIAQLKFKKSEKNSYNQYKFDHSNNVKIEKNILDNKSWEVKKLIKKKIKNDKKKYLMR